MSLWMLEDNTWIDAWLRGERMECLILAEGIVQSILKGEDGVLPDGFDTQNRYAQTTLLLCFPSEKLVDGVADFLFHYHRPGMWVRWRTQGEVVVIECGEGE